MRAEILGHLVRNGGGVGVTRRSYYENACDRGLLPSIDLGKNSDVLDSRRSGLLETSWMRRSRKTTTAWRCQFATREGTGLTDDIS